MKHKTKYGMNSNHMLKYHSRKLSLQQNEAIRLSLKQFEEQMPNAKAT
jgi:hypothetical protein